MSIGIYVYCMNVYVYRYIYMVTEFYATHHHNLIRPPKTKRAAH